MKYIITLLTFLPIALFAQKKIASKTVSKKTVKMQTLKLNTQKKAVALPQTTNPEFPGGMEKLDDYITENFKMSKRDIKKGIKGEITVKFIIEKDGSISNAKILNEGLTEKLNSEALRVIAEQPKWKAGTQSGKPVDVLFAYTIKVGQ